MRMIGQRALEVRIQPRRREVSDHLLSFLLSAQAHDREGVLDYLALILSTVYEYLVRVPKWLMYIISSGATSVLIDLMHKPSTGAQAQAQVRSRAAPKLEKQPGTSDVCQSTATAESAKKAGKRKGRK